MKKIILIVFTLVLLMIPSFFVKADFTDAKAELPPAGALPTSTGLRESSQLLELVSRVISYLLGFIGAVTLGLFLFGGWQYMTAGGDTQKTESAVRLMVNCVIGLIIIFLAWTISNTILAFVFQGGQTAKFN